MTVNDFLLSERPRKVTFQTLSPYFGTLRYSRHPVQQTKNSIPTFEKILFPLPVFLLRQKRIPQAALPGQPRFSTKGFRDPIKEIGPIGGGLDQAGAQGGKRTCMVLLYNVFSECHVSNSFLELKDFERLSSYASSPSQSPLKERFLFTPHTIFVFILLFLLIFHRSYRNIFHPKIFSFRHDIQGRSVCLFPPSQLFF